MGKPRKGRRMKFNYNVDRKKAWKKKKKLPVVACDQLRKAWDRNKTLHRNMVEMGLSDDPNVTLKILTPKERAQTAEKMNIDHTPVKAPKSFVAEELEAEASLPQEQRARLSEPELKFCIYMIEKYKEDYKAMARDYRNEYQLTPTQIRKKINFFKRSPKQYSDYLKSKKGEISPVET